MKCAVFPGSFDPVTLGHLDLIERASKMFDKLIIGVLVNSDKKPLIPMDDRVELLRELTTSLKNVEVVSFEGLLADFVRETGAVAVVRGLRNTIDFEYEEPLAHANRLLNENADTVFLMTAPEYSFVSSSAVKELIRYKADISPYVPQMVINYIEGRN